MNNPESKLDTAKKIMLVGIGGGFDVFTGLPFVYKYKDKQFVLVNSSPKDNFHFRESTPEDLPEGVIRPIANVEAKYTVGRLGCILLQKAYEKIIATHNIDCVLAIDGGVDSMATGDEEHSGTVLEDFIGIAALDNIKVDKVMCCAGFGTETEENMNHYRILENFAKLAESDGFIGSFSLTKAMPEFQQYAEECEHAWAEGRRKSHIQTKIISAVRGGFENNQYADVDPRLEHSTGIEFVSMLSSIYWMFDFDAVAKQNKAIKEMKQGSTFTDSKILLRKFFFEQKFRSKKSLPL